MYSRVLEILYSGSIVNCPAPGCSGTGQKDERCCHITCPQCSSRYCYCCGKQFDDFSIHNEWNIRSEKNDRCPMYLHYRYGTGEIHPGSVGFSVGDPIEALELFHIEKQINLIKSFEATLNEEEAKIYEQMKIEKFSNGKIFEESKIKRLEEINRAIQNARLDGGPVDHPQFYNILNQQNGIAEVEENCCVRNLFKCTDYCCECCTCECECCEDDGCCSLSDEGTTTSLGFCVFYGAACFCFPLTISYCMYIKCREEC